jgi:hypothetical protein
MSRLCHRLVLAASVAASVLAPAAASAVTVDQIVALARSGVTDAVILALIDRDKTILPLDADQLVMLKAEGVSEPVILAMLKSGREEGDRAAQAEADLRAAMILAERSFGPEVTIIGNGSDASNARPYGFYPGPAAGSFFALPYVPEWRMGDRGTRIPRSGLRPPRSGFRDATSPPHMGSFVSPIQPVVPPIGVVVPPTALRQRAEPPQPRAMCRAEVNTATSAYPLTYITACPPAMQPARRR